MKRGRKQTVLLLAILLFAATGAAAGKVESLRKASPMADEQPEQAAVFQGVEPGSNPLMPRGFEGAPPQVPHDNTGLVITPEWNDCLVCHDPANQVENTPFTPATHIEEGQVSKARYVCNLCHVQQTNAKPLVKNMNDRFVVRKK